MMRRLLPTACLLALLALLMVVFPAGLLTSSALGHYGLGAKPPNSLATAGHRGQFNEGARLQGAVAAGTTHATGTRGAGVGVIVFLADFGGTGNNDVWAISPEVSGLIQLTNTADLNEVWAQVSPDAQSLLTVARVNLGPSRYDHSYFLTDLLTGSTEELLAEIDLKRDRPTFSPDGQQLVFARNRAAVDYEDSDIWRVDLNGGNLLRLTDTNYNNYDGQMNGNRFIVYSQAIKFQAGSALIAMIDDYGGSHQTFPQVAPGHNNQDPRWSHDGLRILFGVEGVGMYIMDADGSNVRQLATNAGGGRFSADDALIAYSSDSDLYIMDADGNNVQLVLTDEAYLRIVDFAQIVPVTYWISGKVRDSSDNPIPDVTISVGSGISATTDATGFYSMTHLLGGTYTLTPIKDGWTFAPPTRTASLPPDARDQDFIGEVSSDPFGYGLSTMDPNDNDAHELGFNWIKVYDVPAEHQPVNVLYRVQVHASNWYTLPAFERQLRGLAEAYGDNIDAYEIGNEVNTYDEWGQAPNASRYVDILCTARYAIHQVDPTAEIISAGLAPVGRIDEEWYGHAGHNGLVQDEREYLNEFLSYNGQLCSDAIGYHPMGFRADYDAEPDVDGGTPETDCSNGFCFRGAEKIYEIIQAHGLDDLKVWATEVGWLVEPAEECIGHPSWQGRYWQIVSAEKQAENLAGAFRYARFHWPWLEALFVFNLDFVTAPYYDECEQMSHYSIYGRPAAEALGAMSKVISNTYLPLVLRSP